MDISQALSIIKKGLSEKNVTESIHFKEGCQERNLPLVEITKTIAENEIVGIIQQGQNLYKVWFIYVNNKDLIVIIRMLPDKGLRLVTLYLCNAERRKRENVPKS